jgi:starvation-inducible DNA-binding protein
MSQKHDYQGSAVADVELTTAHDRANRKNRQDEHFTHGQPHLGQRARELQPYGEVIRRLPLALDEAVRRASVEALNQALADTIALRDLYKKYHWQVSGATFYSLHLLFDKHYEEQAELVDTIAERIQLLGGISIAMPHDVAELTSLSRPPRGREEVPVQISRLLEAHQTILEQAHKSAAEAAVRGDDGTNDLFVSNVIRTNEAQAWFVSEHLVDAPLTHAQ